MKHQLWLCGVTVLALVLGALAAPAATSLPLEVIGADGTTVSATVDVPAGGTATKLWLQIHGLTYQEKASVQVNGSAWFALRNNTSALDVAQPGKGYGGIGGIF